MEKIWNYNNLCSLINCLNNKLINYIKMLYILRRKIVETFYRQAFLIVYIQVFVVVVKSGEFLYGRS